MIEQAHHNPGLRRQRNNSDPNPLGCRDIRRQPAPGRDRYSNFCGIVTLGRDLVCRPRARRRVGSGPPARCHAALVVRAQSGGCFEKHWPLRERRDAGERRRERTLPSNIDRLLAVLILSAHWPLPAACCLVAIAGLCTLVDIRSNSAQKVSHSLTLRRVRSDFPTANLDPQAVSFQPDRS
jgi:hypothetical protein